MHAANLMLLLTMIAAPPVEPSAPEPAKIAHVTPWTTDHSCCDCTGCDSNVPGADWPCPHGRHGHYRRIYYHGPYYRRPYDYRREFDFPWDTVPYRRQPTPGLGPVVVQPRDRPVEDAEPTQNAPRTARRPGIPTRSPSLRQP
jgi:hypothetical protein